MALSSVQLNSTHHIPCSAVPWAFAIKFVADAKTICSSNMCKAFFDLCMLWSTACFYCVGILMTAQQTNVGAAAAMLRWWPAAKPLSTHHIACAAVPRAFAMLLMLRPSAAHVCVHKACQVVLSSPAHFAVASTR